MFPKTPWRWKSSLHMFNLFGQPATQCKAGSARIAEGATFEPGCFPLVRGRWGWGLTWAGLCAGQRLCWSGASACSCGAPASARLLPAQVWHPDARRLEWRTHESKATSESEDRRGAQPPHTAGGNITRGETAHGETHPPTPPPPRVLQKRAAAKRGGGKILGLPREKTPEERRSQGQYAIHPPLQAP